MHEARATIESLLRELLQAPSYPLDRNGRATIAAEGVTITLDLPESSEHLHLTIPVGELPPEAERRQQAMGKALAFNLFLERGRGAALAASREGQLLLCYRTRAAGLDATALRNIITNLLTVAADAREAVDTSPAASGMGVGVLGIRA